MNEGEEMQELLSKTSNSLYDNLSTTLQTIFQEVTRK